MPLRALVCLVVLLVAAPAAAERPDWRGLVEGWVSDFNSERATVTLSLDGLELAEESDEAALLVFDAIKLSYGRTGLARSGPGSLALALDEAGLIAFGPAELESPITALKAPGEIPVTLAFSLERLTGLYDPERRLLRELDVELAEIEGSRGEEVPLLAKRLAVQGTLTPGERGRYDQEALVTAQGLTIRAPDSDVGLDRLVLRLETDEADADAMLAWGERLQATERGEGRPPLPPLTALWRKSFGSLLLAGLWAKDKEGQDIFWLEDLRMETGLERGSALDRLSLTFLLEGANLDFQDSADPKLSKAAGVMPQAWRLPLVVEDVPSDALGDLLQDLAAGSSRKKGPVIHPDGKVDFEPFFQALRQAGSRLLIDRLLIAGPAGSLEGGGEVTLDRRHPLGLVGDASFLLGGIKEAEEALKKSQDPDAAKVAFILSTFLKGLGQAEVSDQGEIVYRYDLEFGSDGSSLLNGLPLDSLLGR